jgi:glyoxylase-like metal-dependent hydrolase (beta-lactamase superfamily II)
MSVIVDDEEIRIEKLQLGPYGTNCHIVVCNRTKESLVVDAPGDVEIIIGRLQDTRPKYVLLTHDHLDHIGALAALRSKLDIPLGAHALDSSQISPSPEISLQDGDTISVGNLIFDVLHTPGHTPGGLCFKYGIHLFSGDSIFPGGPGKTRSPANLKQLIGSLKAKVFVLPDDTWIYPGHGEITNLKKEKDEFAVFESRKHSPNLCGDVLWLKS